MESVLEKRSTCQLSTKMGTDVVHSDVSLVGSYLEVGEFYLARSRRRSSLRRAAQHKPWESERIVESTSCSSTTKSVVPLVNDTATTVPSDVKANLGETVDIAFEHIAAECARQREA